MTVPLVFARAIWRAGEGTRPYSSQTQSNLAYHAEGDEDGHAVEQLGGLEGQGLTGLDRGSELFHGEYLLVVWMDGESIPGWLSHK